MGRSVLQIIQQAQKELGLPVSSAVVGNQDQTTVQLFSFLQYSLEELRKVPDKGWTYLQKEYDFAMPPPVSTIGSVVENSRIITNIPSVNALGINFTNFSSWAISAADIPPASRIASIDSDQQITMTMEATGTSGDITTNYIYDMFGNIIYDMFGSPLIDSVIPTILTENIQFGQDTFTLPNDLDYYQNFTFWDRTNHWILLASTPQIDQWHKSGIVATGPRRFYRQWGQYPNRFQFWPPPFELTNPIQAVFEYMSLNAVQVNGNLYSFTEYFENDADTCLLDDRALIMAIKWRFWEQKGMNWASKRKEYDDRVQLLIAQDGPQENLSLTLRRASILISPANVQDGFYPGPGSGGFAN